MDPTGAAGVTRDLRVYVDLGAIGITVIAAVTAQNDRRVLGVGAIAPALITRQLQTVWEQAKPDAVCIGLLPDTAGVTAVRNFLSRLRRRPPIVIDPVIAASSGARLAGSRAQNALVRLWPLATIVTPNLSEAAMFSKMKVTTQNHVESAARALARCAGSVLVTGGDLKGTTCVDTLAQGNRVRRFATSRIAAKMRGAGGILAAALAVWLARGVPLERAVAQARLFVRREFRNARARASSRRH